MIPMDPYAKRSLRPRTLPTNPMQQMMPTPNQMAIEHANINARFQRPLAELAGTVGLAGPGHLPTPNQNAYDHANPNARFLRDGATGPPVDPAAVDPYGQMPKPRPVKPRNPFEMGM